MQSIDLAVEADRLGTCAGIGDDRGGRHGERREPGEDRAERRRCLRGAEIEAPVLEQIVERVDQAVQVLRNL